MKPLFIVFEGIDGSGTTTLSKLLTKTLNEKGHDSVWTKEPSDGTIGRHIRRVLKHEESADELGMFPLFLADRHDHLASMVRPELLKGSSVICDRYAYSTWVYQQDSYDKFLIEYLQRYCEAPDLVFVLRCPVEECIRRTGERGLVERYEGEDKQQVYADRYNSLPRLLNETIIFLDSLNKTVEENLEIVLGEIALVGGRL